jgi:inhibitor of cysteine peptidase
MIQRFLLTILSILLLIPAGGCKTQEKILQLSKADSGTEISLTKGEQFQVTLEANPTTGYEWEWLKDEATSIELVKDPEYQTTADPNLVGAGGATVFTFTAKESGEGTLHLIYHRSFEPDVAPIDDFQVKISVK